MFKDALNRHTLRVVFYILPASTSDKQTTNKMSERRITITYLFTFGVEEMAYSFYYDGFLLFLLGKDLPGAAVKLKVS